jgi:mannose-6-phosphate isomerase-like protein (cupin superfamily)
MSLDESLQHRVDILKWEGQGFRSLIECDAWIVALMNWEHRFDATGVGDIERHNETDEVFVLMRGRGFLFIATEDGIRAFDMALGLVYNVTKGTWHSVIGNKDTSWLIVESRNTSPANTDHRRLSESEMVSLKEQYPSWLS